MDRKLNFPAIDFEEITFEIWQGLGAAFYHAAYVRIYADTLAMRVTGSKRREAIVKSMSQADRDQLQEDVIVFRAHYAAVLWQLWHLCELVRNAYKLCSNDGIITADRRDVLVKTIEDDPTVQEIKAYRNLSHQRAGVVVALHDIATDTFIGHVFPPLAAQSPVQHAEVHSTGRS